MANCVIVGINWGDEGKGRMVDLLTERFDVVVRYQGGGNAGAYRHQRIREIALHLLPSGIFRKGIVNILGNGVALDPENLWQEMQTVSAQGIVLSAGKSENQRPRIAAAALAPRFGRARGSPARR